MELRYKGPFKRDLLASNHAVVKAVHQVVVNVKNASSISQIQHLKKLRRYKIHYRIRVSDDYRIGAIVKGNKIWFTSLGHRSNFYKTFP